MNWSSCFNYVVGRRTACSPLLYSCLSLLSQAKQRIKVPSWVTVLKEAGCICTKISFHRHQLRVKRTDSICDSKDTLDCFVLAGLLRNIHLYFMTCNLWLITTEHDRYQEMKAGRFLWPFSCNTVTTLLSSCLSSRACFCTINKSYGWSSSGISQLRRSY